MIQQIRTRVLQRRNNHEEGNDLVITLFMIPFVLALLFAMIDISSYFQARTQVQNIVRDGAREVAKYSGTDPTIALNREANGGTGVDVSRSVLNKLWDGEKCTISACESKPVVVCNPPKVYRISDDVYCEVTYKYQTMSFALTRWLGLDQISGKEIKLRETFKAETSYSR